MRRLTRRELIRAGVSGTLGTMASGHPLPARAGCPGLRGPIRWIVPNSAGGGYDSFSRLIAPFLANQLGVRIHVDNVPGAGGRRGAAVLSEAAPDGETIGILNLPGLLMTAMADGSALQTMDDFTLLGSITKSSHVWSTRADSEIDSIEALIQAGRPIVFSVNSTMSVGFLTAAIGASVLGLRTEFVAGYSGSSESILAVLRGEVDAVSVSWDSQLDHVRSGELRPLLRISSESRAEHEAFAGAPPLGGLTGLARHSTAEAAADAEALVRLDGAGRVIAAPGGLPAQLGRCLESSLCAALDDPALPGAAGDLRQALDPACGSAIRKRIRLLRQDAKRLGELTQQAVAKVRL